MMIQLDLGLVPDTWRDDQYKILKDYWEDSEEWADIEIIDPKLKTWIALSMPDCIVESL
jgi:hypothetical protein